jgi:hypothetical protein
VDCGREKMVVARLHRMLCMVQCNSWPTPIHRCHSSHYIVSLGGKTRQGMGYMQGISIAYNSSMFWHRCHHPRPIRLTLND